MSEEKKPKCTGMGDKCLKTSQYDSGGSKVCVGCINQNSRKHASHKRMELQILSDITRGVKKSLPDLKLTMKYDTVYHDKKRPDLLISSKLNDNIVMVEVDENQHFSVKHLKEDDARFKNFYVKASEQGKSLSVVRVVPGENTKTSMFKTEKVKEQTKLKRTNGYIEKNSENYNKYIKESVNKIVRIIGDKQSYRYKDQQVSIGPTVDKNSTSPIFSDTSSPDVSPTLPRARAIITNKTSIEKGSRSPDVPATTSRVRPIITNISPISSISSQVYEKVYDNEKISPNSNLTEMEKMFMALQRESLAKIYSRRIGAPVSYYPESYSPKNNEESHRNLSNHKLNSKKFIEMHEDIVYPVSDKTHKKASPPRKKYVSSPRLPKKTTPPRKKSLSPPPLPKKASPPRKKPLSPPSLPKKTTPPHKKSLSPFSKARIDIEVREFMDKKYPSKKSSGFFSFLGF